MKIKNEFGTVELRQLTEEELSQVLTNIAGYRCYMNLSNEDEIVYVIIAEIANVLESSVRCLLEDANAVVTYYPLLRDIIQIELEMRQNVDAAR
jgi:hypothetical protein